MALDLEEIAREIDNGVLKINFHIPEGRSFSRHYAQNRERIAKLCVWGLHSEGGLPLDSKPWEAGFAKFGDVNSEAPPIGILKIPAEVLLKLGYKSGGYVDLLIAYIEKTNNALDCYLTKYPFRQLSKKRFDEIWREAESLGDD